MISNIILYVTIILLIIVLIYIIKTLFIKKNEKFNDIQKVYDIIKLQNNEIKLYSKPIKIYETFDDIIKLYPNFLSYEECDIIINLSLDKLTDSTVYNYDNNYVIDPGRISKTCWFKDEVHPVIKKISMYVEKITGKPIENQEELQIVNYQKGGFFNKHYDACEGTEDFCKEQTKNGGQRYATFLIYLNDNYEGGGTWFPNLNYTTVPKKGDAILFYDTDENGLLIKNSLHQGNDIKNGEKWICNKWVRQLPFIK